MPHYIDGFVIPISKKNVKAYKKMADYGCKLWMKHGALSYYESMGDEYIKHGLGFKKMCKLKPTETVIFAFIVFKSKAHRNRVNKNVMKDMASYTENWKMPFDMKKFAMIGCKSLVNSK